MLLVAVLSAATAAAQGVSVSSQCRPEGGAGDYPVGDRIEFRAQGPQPPELPKGPISVVPPCVDVALTADATGRPPLTFEWEGPAGFTSSTNPAVVDTTDLPAGEYSYLLRVSNDVGEVSTSFTLAVAELTGIPRAPSADESPSPDLQVTLSITVYGAFEWRWDFGDGTGTLWKRPECVFETSTMVHTYLVPGTYEVTASARNCRDGEFTSPPLSITVGGG